jgi:hypothetical protein
MKTLMYASSFIVRGMVVYPAVFSVRHGEEDRSLCSICMGHRRLCGKAICPILARAEAMMKLDRGLTDDRIFGSSPPAVFVGSWNYPRVIAGPLVPPSRPNEDTAIMDSPELWVDKPFSEILDYRLSLVKGKRFTDVRLAENPNRLLSIFQEIVMASRPTDTEMWFDKKPSLSLVFSPREPPSGPSASITRAILAGNPRVPGPVDQVVSDTDLKADKGILMLYDSKISQQQVTRMLSIGLLGVKKQRRLVPTEWSITAVDDILGKAIHAEVLDYPWIDRFIVYGHEALGNNVCILLFPSSWMFEAQEAWHTSPNPVPEVNSELVGGRQTYARELAGAYYAARLPVLEHLRRMRRQAGALVLMEVYPEWIPLGVWRFREICREALKRQPSVCSSFREAFNELGKHLRLPLPMWLERSEILRWLETQTRLTNFPLV